MLLGRKRNCQCGVCKTTFEPTIDLVEKECIVRGYKFEYENYYLKCPKCRNAEVIKLSQLPFKVRRKARKLVATKK